MANNVSRMGALLEQFRQANIQRNMGKKLDIVIEIMNLYRQSDFLQLNPGFKKMMFKKMAEFLESIKQTNAIENQAKQDKYITILETLIDTYYQGYKGEPFNVPLYHYLQENLIVPSQRYDPYYNNENMNVINWSEFILPKAPTQNIADRIRADFPPINNGAEGGRRSSKRKTRRRLRTTKHKRRN